METSIITIAGIFFICFSVSFIVLNILIKNKVQNGKINEGIFPYFFPIICGVIVFTNQFVSTKDFLFPLFNIEQIGIIFLTIGIYLLAQKNHKNKYNFICILISYGILIEYLPKEYFIQFSEYPTELIKIALIIILSLFCFCFQYLNGIDGIVSIQFITTSIGIFLLSLLGGVPQALGLIGLSITSIFLAFLSFNLSPARINMDSASCLSFGFIISWLIFRSSLEGSSSCIISYNMFYLYTILEGFIKIIYTQQTSLMQNTNYVQAWIKGLPSQDIYRNIYRISLFLLIIGTFQLYAPNQYSIPLLSFITVAWFSNNLRNWDKDSPNYKEIHKEAIKELKNNINEIKNNLRKDD